MFIDTSKSMKPLPLTHNPFNAIVGPRPISWVSTINKKGIANLAPFSYFNAVSADPPIVMFAPNSKTADGTAKDSFRNILEIPEFVVNIVSWDLREKMNQTSKNYPPDVSEFAEVQLCQAPSILVQPPRVSEAKASLECRLFQIVDLPPGKDARQSHIVIGNVLGIHIDDELIDDGIVQVERIRPVLRSGYSNYAVVEELFEMWPPE